MAGDGSRDGLTPPSLAEGPAALERALDYISRHKDVWFTRRLEAPGDPLPSADS